MDSPVGSAAMRSALLSPRSVSRLARSLPWSLVLCSVVACSNEERIPLSTDAGAAVDSSGADTEPDVFANAVAEPLLAQPDPVDFGRVALGSEAR